jgi:putative transcriptional regulator
MSNFHPDLDLLTEYAAGSLPLAYSACVSIHVDHCRRCQRITGELTEVGANLFDALAPHAVSDSDLHALLDRLDEEQPGAGGGNESTTNKTPAILRQLRHGDFSNVKWKCVNAELSVSYLPTGDPRYEFALYHMQAGGRIPQHNHRGTEVTLVLEGGFSDTSGTYQKGDFRLCKVGDVHAPTALQSEDCYCLLVLDAPLKFTEWRFRWMNPFLTLRGG